MEVPLFKGNLGGSKLKSFSKQDFSDILLGSDLNRCPVISSTQQINLDALQPFDRFSSSHITDKSIYHELQSGDLILLRSRAGTNQKNSIVLTE